jgi:thioredoxin 1
MGSKIVTDKTFNEDVVSSKKPVLVDFWAEWCGPCRMLAPTVEEIATTYSDKLVVATMNVGENPETASTYGINSVPFFAVFVDGKPAKTIVGARPKSALIREIAEFL